MVSVPEDLRKGTVFQEEDLQVWEGGGGREEFNIQFISSYGQDIRDARFSSD